MALKHKKDVAYLYKHFVWSWSWILSGMGSFRLCVFVSPVGVSSCTFVYIFQLCVYILEQAVLTLVIKPMHPRLLNHYFLGNCL